MSGGYLLVAITIAGLLCLGTQSFSENATDRQNDDMLTLPKKLTKSNGPQNTMMGLSVRKDNGTLTKMAIFGINSLENLGNRVMGIPRS